MVILYIPSYEDFDESPCQLSHHAQNRSMLSQALTQLTLTQVKAKSYLRAN